MIRLPTERAGKDREPFGMTLRFVPTFAAQDDRRFLFIADHCRMNFAEVYRIGLPILAVVLITRFVWPRV